MKAGKKPSAHSPKEPKRRVGHIQTSSPLYNRQGCWGVCFMEGDSYGYGTISYRESTPFGIANATLSQLSYVPTRA